MDRQGVELVAREPASRPHQSLDMDTPASRFSTDRGSEELLPLRLPAALQRSPRTRLGPIPERPVGVCRRDRSRRWS